MSTVVRRRLLLILACRLCGSTRFKKDDVAIECVGCGAIRARRPADERLVATIAGWEECPLTPRELQTLRGIFRLGTYDEVAADHGVAVSTVRTHMHKTYVKLGVPNAVQACLTAYERGWLRDDEPGKDGRSDRSE